MTALDEARELYRRSGAATDLEALVDHIVLKATGRREGSLSAVPTIELPDNVSQNPAHVADEQLAACALMFLSWNRWIRRRTDRVQLLDEVAVRWRIQLEFCIPNIENATGVRITRPHIPLPLLFVRRRLLIAVRVVDESGHELAMLSSDEDRPIVAAMLNRVMLPSLRGHYPEELIERAAKGVSRGYGGLETYAAADPVWHVIRDAGADTQLAPILQELSSQFPAMVWMPYEPGKPRTITFEYEDLRRLNPSAERSRIDRARPNATRFLDLQLGLSHSYHAELDAPPGLQFPALVPLRVFPKGSPQPLLISEGRVLVVQATGRRRSELARVSVELAPAPHGIASMSNLVAGLTAGIFLAASALRVAHVQPSSDASPAVLLALVGILTAFVLPPEGHRLTRTYLARYVNRVRISAVQCGLGAGVLAVQFPSARVPDALAQNGYGWKSVAWWVLTITGVIWALVAYQRRHRDPNDQALGTLDA